MTVGLDDDPAVPATPATPSAAAASSDKTSCDAITFTRGIKYGEDSLNVLDVAAGAARPNAKSPVLLFVSGESFAGDGVDPAEPLVERAMCFAAHNGIVGVRMSYRRAPAAPWPAGARDVAAAISWIHENADLFNGDAQEIIPIGYSAGAFHVASFLAHKELRDRDSDVAGAVLVSGIYRPTPGADDGERAYFGTDASKYDSQSALPGLTEIEVPIVLAWSSADQPRFVTQGETLNEKLCGAGHCPRTALLKKPASPASVFDLDDSGDSLHERLRQLISQIQARGLP